MGGDCHRCNVFVVIVGELEVGQARPSISSTMSEIVHSSGTDLIPPQRSISYDYSYSESEMDTDDLSPSDDGQYLHLYSISQHIKLQNKSCNIFFRSIKPESEVIF